MNLAFHQRIHPQLPPDELTQAVNEFNAGNYLDCCRTLQFISLYEPRQERNLYQGIIQIATGLQHWKEGDYRGSLRLLKTGKQLVQRVGPACLEVDVANFIDQTNRVIDELEKLGMERMEALDETLLPSIRWADQK
jgi:uncharacterized protein